MEGVGAGWGVCARVLKGDSGSRKDASRSLSKSL